MLKKIAALAILMIMTLAQTARADETTNLIDRIRTRYEGMPAFEANFKQILTHKESGAKEERQGRLRFQKPLKIRWQSNAPHEETLLVTDNEIWDYIPEEKIAYKYSPALVQDSRNLIQVLTGQAALNRDFDVKSDGAEKGRARLILYPNEPTTQLTEARIWVEPDTGLIRRASIVDFYGNTNDVELTSLSPKDSLPPSTFKFSPPKGVEVEDRRDATNQELFK
ncbi:MAG: outer membrane lipoprotein chaperone LolA [Desulfovibrio sp.]|nr:outer membrane lipoprotein chaperone LolA [Desulfovibrio sp.]